MSACPTCGKPSGHVGIVVPWKPDHSLDVLHSCLEHGLWVEQGEDLPALRTRLVENVGLLRHLVERIVKDHAHAVAKEAEFTAAMEALEYGPDWKKAQGMASSYASLRMGLEGLVQAAEAWNLVPAASTTQVKP